MKYYSISFLQIHIEILLLKNFMYKTIFGISFIIIFLWSDLKAQTIPFDTIKNVAVYSEKDSLSINNMVNKNFVIHAKKLSGKIILDGNVDEEDWQKAEKAAISYMVLPYDTGFCSSRSDVMMAYDDKAFYIALIAFDSIPGKRNVESLRRDFSFQNNDNICVYMDPYFDQTNGFCFGVNAAGALRDGSLSEGSKVNNIWDCKWESKTKSYNDKWITEMRIPFKSIRYKSNFDLWNIQFSRNDLKLNEKSAWTPVPRQFPTASMAYAGQLKWETPPPKSGLQFSLIPYLFASSIRNIQNGEDAIFHKRFGFDAKIGFSSSVNLDLTYNPDFSQAEVDDQVTNLDRYELYFPEKRQFFLENSDLFANYGSTKIRPFFSRRIGIDAPVSAGFRLSGKVGNDWRVGLMDMQTGVEGDFLARNFFVSTLQKKVFARSYLGAIFVNKQQINTPEDWQGNHYNRLVGLEYNLASPNDFITGKFFGLKSFTPTFNSKEEFSQGLSLKYSRKSILLEFAEYYTGKSFNAEVGYVPRIDYLQINPGVTIKFYPKSERLEYHGFILELNDIYQPGKMELTDRNFKADYVFRFKNRAQLGLNSNSVFVMLRKDFDPTNQGNYFLLNGSEYNWREASVQLISDNRNLFKYSIQSGYGGYFNGNRWFMAGDFNYRVQPYGYLSLILSYNDLMLPQPWGRTDFWLIGSKMDVTITDKVFFTTYIQYNEQADNININARFQWRYKPVSDFFIVYSENYFPEGMYSKNRAVVAKISYWIN